MKRFCFQVIDDCREKLEKLYLLVITHWGKIIQGGPEVRGQYQKCNFLM